MSETPLVSVIIPSFNHAQYVGQAIESVLAQTHERLELIVIDDGSSDDSHAVIRRYEDDPRVTAILNEENRGQSYVFNRAFERTSGAFVALLPSDDWMLPHKLERQLARFAQAPAETGVVYCKGRRYFEDTGEYRDVDLPVFEGWVAEKFITWGAFVYPVTPLFRRECFEKVPMNEGFRAEGEAIYVRLAAHFQFAYVDEVLAVMRDHTYNIGKDTDVMYDEVYRYWDAFFREPDLPASLRGLRSVRMERLHRVKGMQFVGEQRDFARGRACLLRALREKPTNALRPKLLAALSLTFLPSSLANVIVDRTDAGKRQKDGMTA